MSKDQDFTPTGLRIEGAYENDRNADSRELFKAIVREVFGVQDVIIGHHLVYEVEETRVDPATKLPFKYQVIEEIPSADALIFDHGVAEKLWGPGFRDVLVRLALEPCATRDQLLARLYYGRGVGHGASTSAVDVDARKDLVS